MQVTICICTFRRPELLRRLLLAIKSQENIPFTIEVVIIDNDPERSAKPIISEVVDFFKDNLKVHYLDNPNISLARNLSVKSASGKFIVIVDDDEVPNPDWISNLIAVQSKFNADVVFAPVLPEYSYGVPRWVIDGGYFDRRRFKTGTVVDHKDARSGNVLIRRSILDSEINTSENDTGPFDASFGKSGGEDSMLFRQLSLRGALMVWCDEAPVFEYVPLERACASWLLKRSYRTGQIFLRTELTVIDGWGKILHGLNLLTKAFVQMFLSLFICLIYLPVNILASFKWLRTFFSQMGKISYFFGSKTEEYGKKAS